MDVIIGGKIQYLSNDNYLNILSNGVLDLSDRRKAIDWIWKVDLISINLILMKFLSFDHFIHLILL